MFRTKLLLRWAEFTMLFIILPTVITFSYLRVPVIPILLIVSIACFMILWLDPSFDRKRLWNARRTVSRLSVILVIFGCASGILLISLLFLQPELLFGLPRHNPTIWVLVMVLYPILSVYPQEVIYRAFLFHRYADLFPNKWMMSLVSAIAFGYVHIVFGNTLAVVLSASGGWLFARTYDKTQSVAAASFEHALYGCLIFTIGLGQFFYAGATS